MNMFCLSSPHFLTTPTSQEQKDHAAAGLGKKKIEFGDRDGDRFDFLGTLHEEYPKLAAAGEGFYLYKAKSGGGGSRLLEGIPPGPSNYSVKWLRETGNIGNSLVYIKPLQVTLCMEPIAVDRSSMPLQQCQVCRGDFDLLELETHVRTCGKVALPDDEPEDQTPETDTTAPTDTSTTAPTDTSANAQNAPTDIDTSIDSTPDTIPATDQSLDFQFDDEFPICEVCIKMSAFRQSQNCGDRNF